MDKQLVKSIIGERQEEIRHLQLTDRNMFFDDNCNYVLVGVRRAGKSYMMYGDILHRVSSGQLSIEDILYINFEDERLASVKSEELGEILDCYKEMYDNPNPRIYLDEIQIIDGWEKFARRLADSKYRVMITGSNAKMLSSEIATTLGGRFIVREIFPFSFREYLKFNHITLGKNWTYLPEQRMSVYKFFEDYFYYGGFAETFRQSDKREWLNSLYQKILLGDIIARNGIRGSRVYRLLARKLAESVMQPSSLSRLTNIIKSSGENISLPTIKDYIDFMEDAYLIFSVPNYACKLSEQSLMVKRYYIDNGLLNNFLFDEDSKLLENLVAVHLFRNFRNTDEPRLFYYRRNIEIDFYIPEQKLAVQVAYSLKDDDTQRREMTALQKFSEVEDVKHAVIVTYDEENTIQSGELTVEIIPVWKWLCLF